MQADLHALVGEKIVTVEHVDAANRHLVEQLELRVVVRRRGEAVRHPQHDRVGPLRESDEPEHVIGADPQHQQGRDEREHDLLALFGGQGPDGWNSARAVGLNPASGCVVGVQP